MNCCNAFGHCTQGRDCPVRTGKVLPHQAAHVARVQAESCAPEGGNVWFAEPEPELELEPVELSGWETVEAYFFIALFAALTCLVIAGGVGYVVGRWLA